ncbi:hypothetical protein [Klebsiella aerogenes]|uniref:hypothetical protein n=1 Tax=Klebsiella aerogenes TaxID=548 RepID=UPI00069E864F|nr:hypothetical protein [Klebsiella aerogenes]
MADITELAQREKFEAWAHSQKLSLAYGDCGYAFSSTEMAWRAWMASSAELVEALEKAQRYIEELREWNAGLAQESFERQQLISELEPIRAAAEKLVRCKGRYHSEQNYRALAALFGVKTPDLQPLDSESRTVTVKLPPKIERNDADGWFMYNGGRVGGGAAEWYNKALDDVGSELTGPGIKWEAE